MKRTKSWRERLADGKDLPKVKPIPERMIRKWGKGSIVIPAPHDVYA